MKEFFYEGIGIDGQNRVNAITKIMVYWFGLDNIKSNQENNLRYRAIRRWWYAENVEYAFYNKKYQWYTTTDPVEALRWINEGDVLYYVDNMSKDDWEEEHGIELEY